jgi:hypothetical protein
MDVRSSELCRRLQASASVDQLFGMVERRHAQLDASEVAAALATVIQFSRNAAGRPLEDRRMRTLLERARDCLADRASPMDSQDLVEIMRSLAKVHARDALDCSVWESVQAQGERLVDAFSMCQMSQLAWVCSIAPVPTGALMRALATRCEQRVDELPQAQDIATLAYAFAKAAMPAPGLFSAIAASAEQRVGTFNAQDLANTAWAFLARDVHAPGLFAALALHCEQLMGTFNAQELANTYWALATAGMRAPGLFAALAEHSEHGHIQRARPRQHGLVVCDCGRVRSGAVYRAYDALIERMDMFHAQDLANMAWTFTTAGVHAPGLFAALALHCKQRMGTFNAQDLANTYWALATTGMRAPGLFAALAEHSEHGHIQRARPRQHGLGVCGCGRVRSWAVYRACGNAPRRCARQARTSEATAAVGGTASLSLPVTQSLNWCAFSC